MKLLSIDILKEYGFVGNPAKSTVDVDVMSKDGMDVASKNGTFYYVNLGIEYPLKDLTALRKLYKEIKNQDLKAV